MDTKYVFREIDNECWPIEFNISTTTWQQIMSQISENVWTKVAFGVNIILIPDIGEVLKTHMLRQMHPTCFEMDNEDIIPEE